MPAARTAPQRIFVLAGVNGGGKSSLGGARIKALGTQYYNPDEAARGIRATRPHLTQREANGFAWNEGRRLLERAIEEKLDFAIETTLGASTIPKLLAHAAEQGAEVWVWYVGLDSPERHLARVKARVASGGHDIPEADIRRRWDSSRANLVALLPHIERLFLYDNSKEANPVDGKPPEPVRILEMRGGRLSGPVDVRATPEWAKPIVLRALQLDGKRASKS